MDQEKKQSKWPFFISIGLILAVVLSYILIPDFRGFLNEAYQVLTSEDEQRISSWVNKLGWWGPVFIIFTMVAQMFLLVIPSPILMVVAVLAYGPFWGAVLSISAIFVASSVGYWIGKYLGEVTVYKLIGEKKENKLEFYVERYGIWAVIVTRLSPLLSNDAISFVGGILRMGYFRFIGATLAGIIPLTALIAYFGENNQRLKTGLIIVSVISLVILIAYIIYDRKKKPEEQKASHG